MRLEERALLASAIVDLGILPGGSISEATNLNDLGHVIGEVPYLDPTVGTQAFLYRDGALINLGVLPDATPGTIPMGINNRDQVVGASGAMAFLYADGVMTDLLGPHRNPSFALAINDNGQIAGDYATAGPSRPFLFDQGMLIDLGVLPGAVAGGARDINASGQVVGASGGGGIDRAFLWTPEFPNGTTGTMIDLGVLPGMTNSEATAINDVGQVVGRSSDVSGSNWRAFLYSNGVMIGLPALPGAEASIANDINNAGLVVGTAFGPEVGPEYLIRPFLFSAGVTIDLNALLPPRSGWTLERAVAINASGQIAGSGIHNGVSRAFLLTPDLVDDGVGPRVEDLRREGVHYDPTRIVVSFNESVDPARAANPANFRLTVPGPDGRFGTADDRPIGLRSVAYDPATTSVTIVTARRINLRQQIRLTIDGSSPTGITGAFGNLLDGDGDGHPGGDAVIAFHGFGPRRESGPAFHAPFRELLHDRARFAVAVPDQSGGPTARPFDLNGDGRVDRQDLHLLRLRRTGGTASPK